MADDDGGRRWTRFDLFALGGALGVLAWLVLSWLGNPYRPQPRRIVCINNQAQLALAVQVFEANRERYPGWRDTIGGKEASWCVSLLPNLDQQPLYDLWADPQVRDDDPRLRPNWRFLVCPSSPAPDRNRPHNSYVANAGFLPRPHVDPPLPDFDPRVEGSADGVFVNRSPVVDDAGTLVLDASLVTSDDLEDGLSHTVLFSESLLAADWTYGSVQAKYPREVGAPYPDGATVMTFLYAADSRPETPRDMSLPAPAGAATDAMRVNFDRRSLERGRMTVEHVRPSSNHPGGVIMAFADKHVQFVSERIDYRVYQQLLTTRSRESHAPHRQIPVVEPDLE